MMNEDKIPAIFDQIENYVLNRMTPEERHTFESGQNGNKKLQAELALQRELILSVQLGGMQETLRNIAARTASEEPEEKTQSFKWAWAASIAILLGVAAWFALQPSQSDQLFAEYAIAEPGLPVPMSAVNNYDFYDAMVDYKSGKYAKARGKFEALLTINSGNDTLAYFIGTTHFAEGNYAEAIGMYELPQVTQSQTWAAKAQWYAILSHLKLGDKAAINLSVPLKDSPYATQIIEIQQKIAK